jgi:hypothetical protein
MKVPVPACRPCAECDDDGLPVQEVSHLGEAEAGVKSREYSWLSSHRYPWIR